MALLKKRHDVVFTLGGAAALDLLRADPSWDVVVTDVLMAGFSGADIMDNLSAAGAPLSTMPLVFMTGGINDASLQRRVLDSQNPIVAKPISLPSLEDAIVRAIEAAAQPASAPTRALLEVRCRVIDGDLTASPATRRPGRREACRLVWSGGSGWRRVHSGEDESAREEPDPGGRERIARC